MGLVVFMDLVESGLNRDDKINWDWTAGKRHLFWTKKNGHN